MSVTMDPGPVRDLLTVLGGVLTGTMSGAFGVGGAAVSTPAIRVLGCSAALAVGTTLPSILPGAATGWMRYRIENLIDWHIVRLTVPVGIVAAIGGAELAHVLPGSGHPLMIITAVLLVWSAVRLITGSDPIEEMHHTRRPVMGAAAIGALSGGMSGLLGIGGGIVLIPAFTSVLGLPIKRAVATSLVCVGLYAVPGTLTHTLNHGIDWRFAIGLTIGVIPGARLGSVLAMRAGDRRLRLTFGVFLAVIAVIYAGGELRALLD